VMMGPLAFVVAAAADAAHSSLLERRSAPAMPPPVAVAAVVTVTCGWSLGQPPAQVTTPLAVVAAADVTVVTVGCSNPAQVRMGGSGVAPAAAASGYPSKTKTLGSGV
jgi:hypothetical protein